MKSEIIHIQKDLVMDFCGVDIYLISPRIVEIEPKNDSSPFVQIEATITQEDYNEAREAMKKALASEECLKDKTDGHCWCIQCRVGAGCFEEENKIKKINHFVVDSCDTIGYYTGSRHGYYGLCSNWYHTRAIFYGSLNSLQGGSEYCRIKGKGIQEVKEKVDEFLCRQL